LLGRPYLADYGTVTLSCCGSATVRAIVEIWRQGVPPEAIPNHLPHLMLAQVFDALSYYSDNQDEINLHIARNHIPDDLIDPLVQTL
jgi:hypothetical protein